MLNNIDLKSFLIGVAVAGLVGFVFQRIRLVQFGRRAYTRRSAVVPAFRSPAEIRKAYTMTILKTVAYLAILAGIACIIIKCRS